MSTATLSPRVRPTTKLLTAEELAGLPSELNGHAVKYELYDGELIVMAPPGAEHGRRQGKIYRYLDTNAEELGLGVAYSEVGLILRRKPDRVVGPDGAFVLTKSLPAKFSKEGYLLTIPEIVIEVRSKNDSLAEIKSKCEEYFAAGVLAVLVLDSKSKTVTTIRSDHSERVFKPGETLTCQDLLPGFAVPVDKLFI